MQPNFANSIKQNSAARADVLNITKATLFAHQIDAK
jgi:hypothetical protein